MEVVARHRRAIEVAARELVGNRLKLLDWPATANQSEKAILLSAARLPGSKGPLGLAPGPATTAAGARKATGSYIEDGTAFIADWAEEREVITMAAPLRGERDGTDER